MPSTQTPQQIVEDRKVAGLLDDLEEDGLDADKTAGKLSAGKAYKAMGASAQRLFDSDWDAHLAAMEAVASERDVCLKGKAKDTRKLKAAVQAMLDKMTAFEEAIGRLEVLEDSAANAALTLALTSITAVLGVAPKLALVQKDLADLYKRLQKAIIAARDAKVKAAVTAASGAAGVCLASFGAPVALIGGLVLFSAETAIGAAFNGTEDSVVKKTWGYTSGAITAADALGQLGDAFGPAVVLTAGAVDIGECFAAESEKAALFDAITRMKREFDSTIAQCARELATLGKALGEAQKTLRDAIAAVNAVRVPTPSSAAVLRYL